MKTENKYLYIKLVIIFLLISCILIYFYTSQLKDIVEDNTLTIVEEVAANDKRSIKACLDFLLFELHGVEKRLSYKDNIQDIEIALNLESASTQFNRLFLITEDGKIYTDNFLVYTHGEASSASRFNFEKIFSESNSTEIITRFDDEAKIAGIARESLMIAIKLDNFKIGQTNITALVGFTSINFLQNHMILYNFSYEHNSYGFTSVIDMRGNYIVGNSKDIYLSNDPNFFSQIGDAESSSLDKGEILDKMKSEETFDFFMENSRGRQLVYLTPFYDINSVNWYMIIFIDVNYLSKWQSQYSTLCLILFILLLFLLGYIIFYNVHTHNRIKIAKNTIRLRNEFYSNIGVEIKKPINSLMSLAFLLSENISNVKKLAQNKIWIQQIESMSEYLLTLVNNILDLSKLDFKHITLQNDCFSITSLLDSIIDEFTLKAQTKNINVIVEKDIIYPYIVGDETRTRQILANIIDNAIKYTKNNGKVIFSIAQSQVDDKNILTTYCCEDNGIGIDRQFLRIIFDPFMQEKRGKIINSLNGAGLGLPICKKLVDAMGGEISVESKIDMGTVFIVDLPTPICEKGNTAGEFQKLATHRHNSWPWSNKILLCCGSKNIEPQLRKKGFEVNLINDITTGIEIYKNSIPYEYGVVILDAENAEINASEAACVIRNMDRPDAAGVLILSWTDTQDSGNTDDTGCLNGFLSAPFDVRQFLKKYKENIDSSKKLI